MNKITSFIQDKIGHYPVLFFGAVAATIKWKWRHLDNVDDVFITAWITYLQTIFTLSKKGAEEIKQQGYDKAIADVSSLQPQGGD